VESGRKAVVAQPADGGGSVSITLQRRSKTVGDREVLTGYFGTTGLRESAVLEQSGLTGYTAVAPAGDGDNQRRLAMLNYGGATYLFEGKVDDDGSFADFDTSFLQIVETFRPMAKREREAGKAMELVYIRADDDTTFAGLARQSPVRDAEDTLRLINGYYPRGEPPLGEYIKIIRQVENPR
jgi:predicted Zn-dependent protease